MAKKSGTPAGYPERFKAKGPYLGDGIFAHQEPDAGLLTLQSWDGAKVTYVIMMQPDIFDKLVDYVAWRRREDAAKCTCECDLDNPLDYCDKCAGHPDRKRSES